MIGDTENSALYATRPPLAPVAVYTYTRVDHFHRTVLALEQNRLAAATVLYVVSDGPKTFQDASKVQAIRNIADGLRGFREVVKIYREQNLGASRNIISADERIIRDHGRLISMEDDNITSVNFLDFINQGLNHFECDETVFSICGYRPPSGMNRSPSGDYWFFPWHMTWGYGTWKKKFEKVFPLVNRYPDLKRNGTIHRLNRDGGLYISDSLRRDFKGQARFPDSVLCASMYCQGMKSVLPTVSKVLNIGSDGSGTSSRKITNKYDVALDTSDRFAFDFSYPSPDSTELGCGVKKLLNGQPLTRLTRRLGIYHEALQIKNRLCCMMKK